ncbi:MAG: SH3 domain-containing protein [Caldilineaceae bacterium]|nr:SH3 domain-containing protein [Caldilineaceae bacterium]
MRRSSYDYDEPPRRGGSGTRKILGALLSLVLPALIIIALLLPPISLIDRIQYLSYTTIDRNGGSLMDPDGTTIVFPPESVMESFQVNLESIPRMEFLDGNAGQDWAAALNALSNSGLEARSPIYEVAVRGGRVDQSIVQIPIPNDSQPYETLELYSWDGDSWEFVPSSVLSMDDRIEARVSGWPPSNFVVMQTGAPPPRVETNIGVGEQVPATLANAGITSLAIAGFYLRGDGALDIERANPPVGNYAVVPVLRNWRGMEPPRSDLLHNMLVEAGQLQNQINAVADLLIQYNYPGVIVDYRGMDAAMAGEAEFNHFIERLAERLHAPEVNRWLAVRVESPHQVSPVDWNTRGYDWQALGSVADRVLIPGPADPAAYQMGGALGSLLAFATDQIDRRKVQLELPGMSVERSEGQLWLKGFRQVLQPLVAQIRLGGEDGVIQPGQPVQLSVENPRISQPLAYDGAIGAYMYSYVDDQQMERTVTIENSSSFAHKLTLLNLYGVTQVMVRDADSGDVDPDLWEVARQFQTGGNVDPSPTRLEVAYTIFRPDGTILEQVAYPIDNPVHTFQAPAGDGDVRVEAQVVQVSSLGNRQSASPGNVVAMPMATPTPVATATPVPTPTPEVPTLASTQVVNVREGPGTNYPRAGQIIAGRPYLIFGKNQAGDWWQIDVGNGTKGWVFGGLVTTSGSLDKVALITDIPDPPPAAAPAVAAPAPAGGGNFGYGVQAHMVHNNQAGQVMQKTRELGFNWVKQQIEWKVFEHNQGNYDWGSMQGIIDSANNAGINLLFSVVNSPPWAREANFEPNAGGPPADPNTFARFLGAMAGKYCGSSLKAIEVWNEQNLHYEWGNLPLDPAKYVELLKPAYASIKAACPSMLVISGALTPAASNGSPQSRGGTAAMDDFEYLERMFQAGLNNYMDGIGAHPSGYNVPPQFTWEQGCEAIRKHGNSFNGACDNPHHSWSFRSTMEGYRNIAVKYGAGNKLIWPTEFGWAAGGAFDPRYGYANDNSYEEQAAWTVEAYRMMKGWGWVGPAILWNLNFRVVADGTEKAQWGIVRNDWSPLPIFHALRDMPK